MASRPSRARARARPEASSSGVSGPFSGSHVAMARRPASSFSRCSAAFASHALKVVPWARGMEWQLLALATFNLRVLLMGEGTVR